jgi:hypothetical protein
MILVKSNFSRRLLENLQAKAGANVDEDKLRALAGQVKRSDLEDEEKLRNLIRSVAMLSGRKLTPEKEEQVLQMFRDQEINVHDMTTLTKFLK